MVSKPLATVLTTLVCFISVVFTSPASAETESIPCADRPFKSSTERTKVRKESPECYELRTKYELSGAPDAQPLQDLAKPDYLSTLYGLQNQLQLLLQLQSTLPSSANPIPSTDSAINSTYYPPTYIQPASNVPLLLSTDSPRPLTEDRGTNLPGVVIDSQVSPSPLVPSIPPQIPITVPGTNYAQPVVIETATISAENESNGSWISNVSGGIKNFFTGLGAAIKNLF